MIKLQHNVETNEIVEIEMTKKEIQELDKISKSHFARMSAIEKELSDEDKAKWDLKKEILDRIGLSIDDAKILLG